MDDIDLRKKFDDKSLKGDEFIFKQRKVLSDFTLINKFVDQDFVDRYNLAVIGKRINPQKQVIEYYVKSKNAKDYKKMLIDSLIHPPVISVDKKRTKDNHLYLVHKYEGKQLVSEFIHNTMLGIEYLWGGQVTLTTHKLIRQVDNNGIQKITKKRVMYNISDKRLRENSA